MTTAQLAAFRHSVEIETIWEVPGKPMTVADFDALDAERGQRIDELFRAFGIDPDAPVNGWNSPLGIAVERILDAVTRAARARI